MDDKIAVDFEQDALDALTARAEAHGRDVAEEVRSIVLEKIGSDIATTGKKKETIDYVAWSRRIRAMTPKDVPQTDSLVLLREDRDR